MVNETGHAALFFKTPGHEARLIHAMREVDQIHHGVLDSEYAAALYILTAEPATWRKTSGYVGTGVNEKGIDFEGMKDEQDFSGGYSVLIELAHHLFNGQVHIDPLEFLRLDDANFRVALTAIQIRRDPPRVTTLE